MYSSCEISMKCEESPLKFQNCDIMLWCLSHYIQKVGDRFMKKRILTLVLGACLAISLAGCGKQISNDKITIKQYKGLEVEETEVIKVTDEDVESSIASTLSTMATYTDITDRAVEEGDVVTMDYVGTVDGVAFERGTAQGAELEIGSGTYIPGFEEQLIGHKVGEVFDINVTFPEGYSEELGGKDAVFNITLNKIQQVNIPELTDELLPQIGTEAKTVEEYKKEVKADLEKSNKESAETENMQKIWQALIENCVIDKYPEDKLEETISGIESEVSYIASMYNMEPAAFVEQYYGITPEDMAKNLIKQEYAIDLIVEKEKLELTNKEYEEGLKALAEQYGYEKVEEFEEEAGAETAKQMVLQNKVGDFLKENCKFVKAKDTDKKDK